MEGDEDKKKYEKINEWSKPVKGGPRVGNVEYEEKISNGTSNNRHKLFEDKGEVDEDEDKSSSDATSEELRTTKGKKIRNNPNEKNGNNKRDKLNQSSIYQLKKLFRSLIS